MSPEGPEASPVEGLLVHLLERVEDSGSSVDEVLDDLCTEHPDHAHELRDSVRVLIDTGLLSSSAAVSPTELPGTIGEYVPERVLGRGGMAVVYLARRGPDGQRVALKLLRPAELAFENARARFRREVAAVARLEHPGIVGVHAVGQEGGVPYLAMEYVEGCSLARVLLRLSGRDPVGLGGEDLRAALEAELEQAGETAPDGWDEAFFAGTWSDACLRVARGVAEALDHAHERGVLHRDVKPSNVMITPRGRVVLLDFGLAAVRGADQLTRSGAELGSLPYMAPEQLEHGPGAVDRRTDVYQLGVTLYELLTLRSPFLDRLDRERTRQRILEARPTPLRRALPALAPEIEMVCRAAMEPDADRRYSSAGALGVDLANALGGRPVSARPSGPLLRGLRLAARHRVAAGLLGVLVSTAIVVPGLFAVRESWARERIEDERLRARDGYVKAIEALELVSDTVIDQLADVPMADEPRRAVLEGVVAFLEQLDPAGEQDPRLQRALRRGRLNLANLYDRLGRRDEALEVLRQLREHLKDVGPGADVGERELMLRVRMGTADANWALGNHAVAEAELRAAEILLAGDEPLDLVLRGEFELRLGTRLRQLGRGEEARRWIDASLETFDELGRGREVGSRATILFAGALMGRAQLELQQQRWDAAIPLFERAAAVCDQGLERDPENRTLQNNRAVALANVGSAHFAAGRLDLAEPPLVRAEQLARDVVERYPLVPGNHGRLIGVISTLVALRGAQGEDVRDLLMEQLAAREDLADRFGSPRERWLNCVVLESLAGCHGDTGEHDLELTFLDRSLELAREGLAAVPGDPNFARCERSVTRRRAETLCLLDRHEEAVEALDDMITPLDERQHVTAARVLATSGGAAHLARALAHLEQALALGAEAKSLREDPMLEPLRSTPAFQELFED